MTTIVAVKKNGFVAIAADTLTKFGYTKESAAYISQSEKIFRLGDSFIAVSGAATSDLAIRDYFHKQKKRLQLNSVSEIFRVWNELYLALKDHYFLNPGRDNDDDYESLKTRVLIANAKGIFGVDAHRYVQEFTKFHAYGSGREFALGSMFASYDLPLSAEEIAVGAVTAAAEFDDATGLPINSYSIKCKSS